MALIFWLGIIFALFPALFRVGFMAQGRGASRTEFGFVFSL